MEYWSTGVSDYSGGSEGKPRYGVRRGCLCTTGLYRFLILN